MLGFRKFLGGRGISVSQKLMMVVGFCIALTCLIAGVGLFQMNNIGGEINVVANEDIPLTKVVGKISSDQFKQAALLERLLRVAGIKMASDDLAGIETSLKALSAKTAGMIVKGEQTVAAAMARTSGDASAEAEYAKIKASLEKIKTRHDQFEIGRAHV